MGFRNEHDGHSLAPALEQVKRLAGKSPEKAKVDRGYRGIGLAGETEILIPSTPKKSDGYYKRRKLSNAHNKRAAMEPVIGHLKSGHGLNRIFYKGVVGDDVNTMLAAAAFNFKRMMNKWESSFRLYLQKIFLSFCNLIFLKSWSKVAF